MDANLSDFSLVIVKKGEKGIPETDRDSSALAVGTQKSSQEMKGVPSMLSENLQRR